MMSATRMIRIQNDCDKATHTHTPNDKRQKKRIRKASDENTNNNNRKSFKQEFNDDEFSVDFFAIVTQNE